MTKVQKIKGQNQKVTWNVTAVCPIAESVPEGLLGGSVSGTTPKAADQAVKYECKYSLSEQTLPDKILEGECASAVVLGPWH